jgi:putative SOS response-associated peptidase YedK
MCGRFSLVTTKEKLLQQLPLVEVPDALHVSYNVAPTQNAYVVTDEDPSHLQQLAWGLVPYWSDDGKNAGRLINARREGIETKPSFRVPIRKQRCLVPADSFYEWRKEGRNKVPYRILLKNDNLMVFAGVWDEWRKDGRVLRSFSIITTDANADMAELHDRMPVLLTTAEQQRRWLESGDLDEVLAILQTPPDHIIEKYRVSEKVNSVANDSPMLHSEVQEPPTLFS